MDNNQLENKDTAALLREIAALQRQNARIGRIAAAVGIRSMAGTNTFPTPASRAR